MDSKISYTCSSSVTQEHSEEDRSNIPLMGVDDGYGDLCKLEICIR